MNAGLAIELVDERTGDKQAYKFEGGIREFVKLLNKAKAPLHEDVVYIRDERDNIEVEIALQWNDSYQEQIFPYTNNGHNRDGGTHLTGFRAAPPDDQQYAPAHLLKTEQARRRRRREALTRPVVNIPTPASIRRQNEARVERGQRHRRAVVTIACINISKHPRRRASSKKRDRRARA